MVGAIADWFAVTALFKHPLGLPVPHTALIPRRKDELGRSLEEFVGENFLQEGDHPRADRVGDDLAAGRASGSPSPPTYAAWSTRSRRSPSIGLGKVRDEHIADLVTEALIPRFREEPIAPLARRPARRGRARRRPPRPGRPRRSTSCTAGWWSTPTRSPRCSEQRAPWWAPPRLNDAVTRRLHTELVRLARATSATTRTTRPGRRSTRCWPSSPTTCSTTRETQERTERLKERLLDHPQVVESSIALWNALRRALQASLVDPEGAVRAAAAAPSSTRVRRPAARGRGRCAGGSTAPPPTSRSSRSTRYGAEVTAVITHTIAALGRQGGRPPDRAARRPRPAVHPDQRHHRRRPRRRADPYRRRAGRLRPARRQMEVRHERVRRTPARRVDPARPVPQAGRPGRHRRRRQGAARRRAGARSTARSRPGAAASW